MTSSAPTRFAHLIYTSFDDGSGSGGGWQVKDVSGDLDPTERDALTAWVSTRFDLQPVLERYPTPEAIEGRERRLMYAAVPGGAAYWHTAEAGTDGSGRPGNVFAHVVLDRAIEDPIPAFRPIELWRSPSWSMPYGPAATRSAVVTSTTLPELGTAVSREKVLAFLTDVTVYRLGVLQVLLDAVAHAWEGGPPVVLLTENTRAGTLWIGAVSFFMSPATSRHFSWSTHDRASAVVENVGRKVHLTVAPDSEKESFEALGDIVVLDSQDDPILGVLDGDPHRTHRGVSVEVTPWSMLAQASLTDYATALSVVELQDAEAEEAGDHGLSPMWPLAIAVLSIPSLVDVKREASRVVAEHRPGSLLPESRLAEFSDEIDAEFAPQSAVEAMAALVRSKSHGRNTTGALSSLIRLAVRDDKWMSLHPASEIGAEFADLAPSVFSTDIRALIGELSDLACDRFAKKSDLTVRLLRIADVLVATNADVAVSFDLVEQLCQVFETVAAELMDPLAGPRIVGAVGRTLDERTLRLVVRRTLATMPRFRELQFGHRFSSEVIRWLFPSDPKLPALHQVADRADNPELRHDIALFSEYVYGSLCLPALSEERGRMTDFADLAVWGILDDQLNRTDPVDRSEDVRALCRLNTLSPSDVGALFRTFGVLVPPEAARHAVLYADASAHLATVLAHLTAAGHRLSLDDRLVKADQVTIAWGALRGLADWGDLTRLTVEEFIDTSFGLIMDDYNEVFGHSIEAPQLAQDLSQKLGILFYIAESVRHGSSAYTPECRSYLIATAESQPSRLRTLISRGIVDVSRMVGKSFIDFVEQRYTRPSARPSREDEFLSELVRQQLYSGPSDSDSLRDAMWPLVRDMAAHDAERVFADYPRCVGEWLEARGIRRHISDIRPSEDRGSQW